MKMLFKFIAFALVVLLTGALAPGITGAEESPILVEENLTLRLVVERASPTAATFTVASGETFSVTFRIENNSTGEGSTPKIYRKISGDYLLTFQGLSLIPGGSPVSDSFSNLVSTLDSGSPITCTWTFSAPAGPATGSITLSANITSIDPHRDYPDGGDKNSDSKSYTVNVASSSDTSAPTGSITINSNALYTNDTDVLLNLSATDNVGVTGYRVANGVDASGAATVPVTSTTVYTDDVDWTLPSGDGEKWVAVQYCDAVGNWSVNYTDSITLDQTPPVVTISTPANGAKYLLNQEVLADWSATDTGGSGIAIALATVPCGSPIDTSTVGSKTFWAWALDNAGNRTPIEGVLEVSYSVCYAFSGVLQPINSNGSSIFKLGSTVPVKFRLTDANGSFISNATARIFVLKLSNGITGTELEAVSTSAATTGNLFRYDPDSNQYIFNLATKPLSTGTWQIRIELDDGESYYVQISLK